VFSQRFVEDDRSTGTSKAKRRKATAGTHRLGLVGNAAASSVPPLHWWRRLPADAFNFEHLAVLRRAVSGIGMVGEPRWADAVQGHPAAAVSLARRVMEARRPLTPIADLTASTLLMAAIATGDAAAISMLLMMIERMAAGPKNETLKRSWLRQQQKPDGGCASKTLKARHGRH
jgi:hypothetical protein